MAKKRAVSPKIEAIRHRDKRTNSPTEELRDFVVEDEFSPNAMLYPRDPSLDPQLVWKGKDEQDRLGLAVSVVPIYIQEKIQPQVIIDALPRINSSGANQTNLFADFNGGPQDFAQRIEFYQHEQNWSNRLVLGDSLLVMTSLSEKEGLKGKVQAIYIDPPYGIKFGSNWQVSTRKRDVRDGKAEDATRQPEQVRAFRDTWKLGIHSYLAYLRDRLVVAHDLLTETGSIFLQIGDENVHLVRSVLDETFGSENFIAQITVQKMAGLSGEFLNGASDYVLWFAKDRSQAKFRELFRDKVLGEGHGSGARYDQLLSPENERIPIPRDPEKLRGLLEKNWKPFQLTTLTTFGSGGSSFFPFKFDDREYFPAEGKGWLTTREGLSRLAVAGRIVTSGKSLRYLRFLEDFPRYEMNNVWTDIASPADVTYVVQTSTRLLARCLLMTTDPGDLVLDPTCGGGTTAYVAEQWGRRWITCDTSRVALALTRTRMMAARYPYYLLGDSAEGLKKETDLTGKTPPDYKTGNDIRKGFVYKRVRHITLKSIAKNPDIVRGMNQDQIDAAILRNADSEMLYDDPYSDTKRVRVCGPFSVESLSPHRVLSTADDNQDGSVTKLEAQNRQDFANMILDNLKKAGVQNSKKGERLDFDRLDPFAGTWLNAVGEFTDSDGKTKRVAVSIGPEQGTVGPQQVKEAAKEAVRGVGFSMLIICGFAFDPHVTEEAKRYGALTVLPAKMNPDLAMGDELLKKTGAGNLFMVFGEPDVDFRTLTSGQIVVEIKGLDVYDPTTGQIRNSSTDDIACWFIDTDYNGESFFVRHAYFTGAGDPYNKLRKTLRTEIDEAAWNSLYSTTSRPFDKPQSSKIAIKVINHYGDEVLKVFDV